MRTKNRVESILLHGSVICSLVCLTMKVLDWYNPYMDFVGHASLVEYALYFSVLLLAVMETVGSRSRRRR